MRIGLMYCSTQSDNLGVQALAYSSMWLLRKACDRLGLDLEIMTFDGPVGYSNRSLDIAGRSFPVEALSFSGLSLKSFCIGSKMRNELAPAFRKCDLIWDTGGGDSFSDIYGKKLFLFLCLLKSVQFTLRKRVIMAPQTIGPFSNKWVRTLARYTMRRTFRIYSRDAKSSECLRDMLPTCSFKAIAAKSGCISSKRLLISQLYQRYS